MRTVYFFRGEGVVFYVGERQVERGNNPEVDTVEVRFIGSKGNLEQNRAMPGMDARCWGQRGTKQRAVAVTMLDTWMVVELTTDGLPELRRVAGLDQRPRNSLLTPWAVGSG